MYPHASISLFSGECFGLRLKFSRFFTVFFPSCLWLSSSLWNLVSFRKPTSCYFFFSFLKWLARLSLMACQPLFRIGRLTSDEFCHISIALWKLIHRLVASSPELFLWANTFYGSISYKMRIFEGEKIEGRDERAWE